MQQQYVMVFLFDPNSKHVALLRKRRGPKSIIGFLTAVGGKVEPLEHSLNAAYREFKEETGVSLIEGTLDQKLVWTTSHSKIFVYAGFSERVNDVHTVEEEEVAVFSVEDAMLRDDVTPQAKWMIQMILDRTLAHSEVESTHW